jgi:hypothetical protein
VRDRQHDVIGGAFELRLGDRDHAVVREAVSSRTPRAALELLYELARRAKPG